MELQKSRQNVTQGRIEADGREDRYACLELKLNSTNIPLQAASFHIQVVLPARYQEALSIQEIQTPQDFAREPIKTHVCY